MRRIGWRLLCWLRARLPGVATGELPVTLRTGAWSELREDAAKVRLAVFVREQGVPIDLEWDDDDAAALHVVAYDRLGRAVATGRLVSQGPGVARIGRMAVRRALRGRQIGQAVLRTLIEAARDRGDHELVLHAQCSAEGFYRRHGFLPHGEVFMEAGIAHVEMRRRL